MRPGGTDVCTDVVFLQKRQRELEPDEVDLEDQAFSWVGTTDAALPRIEGRRFRSRLGPAGIPSL